MRRPTNLAWFSYDNDTLYVLIRDYVRTLAPDTSISLLIIYDSQKPRASRGHR